MPMHLPGRWLLLACSTAFALPAGAEEAAFADVTEATRDDTTEEDVAAFNRSVSDDEIQAWLQFLLQFDPERLQEWQHKTAAQQSEAVLAHRRGYESRGLRIPVLRGMTAREMEQFSFMAQMATRQFAKLEWARALLPRLTRGQLLIVRDTCADLLARHPRAILRNVQTPAELAFLQPDLIRLNPNGCSVFLQKGVGTGYSLEVRKEGEHWRLSLLDAYRSWEAEDIPLD